WKPISTRTRTRPAAPAASPITNPKAARPAPTCSMVKKSRTRRPTRKSAPTFTTSAWAAPAPPPAACAAAAPTATTRIATTRKTRTT
ncbi:MAG: hypothetical protein AVDCRST_MAG56-8029, partial [uncultured Cytophagales bacterium]